MANAVLNMVRYALDIFKSSETMEKRQMLNFLFQNFQLNGKKLGFDLRKPFEVIANWSEYSSMLPN